MNTTLQEPVAVLAAAVEGKTETGEIDGWVTALSWGIIGMAVLSALIIAADIARGNRQMTPVMNLAYPVNASYLGFFILPAYFRHLRQTAQPIVQERAKELVLVGAAGTQEEAHGKASEELKGSTPVKVLRVNGEHGWTCWVGDIVGAWVVFWTGWVVAGKTLYAHFIAEYLFALAFGVLVAWHSKRSIMGMPAGKAFMMAARDSFLGISTMLAVLFLWMAMIQVWLYQEPLATDTAAFWGINMIPGMILGYLASYPVSAFMMKMGWKHPK